MSDLGALLRKAREQRGYTLDDIQEYTKIRKRYLEAIETGEYKVLPGSFYVRAFVKTYAETVGLDAEEVLRLYHKELPQPTAPESVMVEPARIKAGRRSHQHNDRWGKVAVSLLMWAFPVLIVIVIYIYYSNNNDPNTKELNPNPPISTETASESPTMSIAPTPTPTMSETPPPSEAVTLTLKETRGGISYYEVASGTNHQLQIEITGRCWVGVNKDNLKGESLYNKIIETADTPTTLHFDLTGPIFVSVGRADLAVIKIDNVEVTDGDKSGPSRFIFSPIS